MNRWFSVILMTGLILALSSLSAQADPYKPYDHHAYGWDDRAHGFCHHHEYFGHPYRGPHLHHYLERVYGGPPPVAYVAPAAPVIGIPYAQPQPYFSQPAPRGLSGTLQYNF